MEDVSFLEMVSGSVPRDWVVAAPGGGPWVGARPRRARIPRAGWKLHVSATVRSAVDVLERSLPVVVGERVAFKVPVSRSALSALNEGEGGAVQAGKFLTVYPRDDDQAVRLAVALDAATVGLAGPPVTTDRPLRRGSIVHYRYGLFSGRPDEPDPDPPVPDPFVAGGAADPEVRAALAGRYVGIRTIHRSRGGSVELAADLRAGRACVLKRAYRDAGVGPEGHDARDRLRHEAAVLQRLAPDQRFPAVLDLVDDDGDTVLVLEHLDGRTLGSMVTAPRPVAEVVSIGRAVASALALVHRHGLAHRDVNPANVLLTGEGEIRLVDLELAHELGAPGEVAGTPGYASPEQLAGRPASIGDDVYALGGVLWFLASATDPGTPLQQEPDERLSRIVARARHGDPGARYGSIDQMDAALAELEVP